MLKLLRAAAVALLISGCASAPTDSTQPRELSPTAKAAMTTAGRIAVRHWLTGKPERAAKVAHIRQVAQYIQSVLASDGEYDMDSLRTLALAEIAKLNLNAMDEADAVDLVDLLSIALREQLGPMKLDLPQLATVKDYLDALVLALPAE